jgi:Mechanosensitive ion channel
MSTRGIDLAPGLSYAASSLLNYVILALGFVAALGVLGVDFSKVSLLAGAFGVGIGFGLQSIVNNFVSGLILLFERPIHVGDTVDVGDLQGTVRRIGIRASVIHTGAGADIISARCAWCAIRKPIRTVKLLAPPPGHRLDPIKKTNPPNSCPFAPRCTTRAPSRMSSEMY